MTDVYHKPTDAHRYLHYQSYHPRHVFYGIVYGQSLRYRRIINSQEVLDTRLDELQNYFIKSGYPVEFVKPIIDEVRIMDRNLEYVTKDKDKPFHIAFPVTFGIGSDYIKQYINTNVNTSLTNAQVFKSLDKPIVKSVSKRAASLRSLLFNQKAVVVGSELDGKSVRCTTDDESKHRRGPKCLTCPMMSNESSFTINNKPPYKCMG